MSTSESTPAAYPCADCGKLRTKDEGGTTFTVCDECWDKHHSAPTPAVPGVLPTAREATDIGAEAHALWLALCGPFGPDVYRPDVHRGTACFVGCTRARRLLDARDRAHAADRDRVRREALEEVAKQILEARGPSRWAATGYTEGVWRGYNGALDIVLSLAPIPPARGGR